MEDLLNASVCQFSTTREAFADIMLFCVLLLLNFKENKYPQH